MMLYTNKVNILKYAIYTLKRIHFRQYIKYDSIWMILILTLRKCLSHSLNPHYFQDLSIASTITSVCQNKAPAIEIFAHALRFMKDHLMTELSKQLPE